MNKLTIVGVPVLIIGIILMLLNFVYTFTDYNSFVVGPIWWIAIIIIGVYLTEKGIKEDKKKS